MMRPASDAMSGLSSLNAVGVEHDAPYGEPTGVVHPVWPSERRERFVIVFAVTSSMMISSCPPVLATKTILVWLIGSYTGVRSSALASLYTRDGPAAEVLVVDLPELLVTVHPLEDDGVTVGRERRPTVLGEVGGER